MPTLTHAVTEQRKGNFPYGRHVRKISKIKSDYSEKHRKVCYAGEPAKGMLFHFKDFLVRPPSLLSELRRTPAVAKAMAGKQDLRLRASLRELALSSNSPMGMTGLDSVIHGAAVPLPGMATIPVPRVT